MIQVKKMKVDPNFKSVTRSPKNLCNMKDVRSGPV